MSRANRYFPGAHWVKTKGQNGIGVQPIVEKVVASNNTLAIFPGDFLDEQATGCVYPSTVGGGAFPCLAYVCVGVKQYKGADGLMRAGKYLPAATIYTGEADQANPQASVLLCTPCINQIFAVVVPTAVPTQAEIADLINKCIDIGPSAGNTVSGMSGHITAASTAGSTDAWQATTVTNQLRLIRIPDVGRGLNDPLLANWTGHFEPYETRGII
jgi:hypothetical protein